MLIANEQQLKQDRSRKRWTPFLDKVLADLVVKQIQSGNRHNNVFDSKTWNNIRREFNEQTELNFNNVQLRKHLAVLRQRYNTLESSHSHVQNESVLEEDTRCILGFDLLEEDSGPRSEPVKVKDCPIYEQLCTIFGDDSVDGRYAQSSHFEGLEESMANQSSENVSTPTLAQADTNLVDRKRKREPDSKTSLGPSHIDPDALEKMAGALSDMVTAFRSRMADSVTQEDRFSITNCINVLDEIENVDEGVYFAALDLFENPGLRETFLSLNSNKLRLTWLQGKCRKLSPSVSLEG
ncbi:PREDICTED: L10-interacting MYB domain-containing protein-like isoform X2 [Camelina sativa]|uniref:L10-interacting MYB domain-containing protein-like isoform X2 n=1 Tax=Camelina sativa TaxID=90675 RepID=A0ABM0SUU6_CAMSA|nr:PREDICTED: L10-interacting MYB domain-containing protein-like isoform X2 [Camelina sativa]